MAKTRIKESLSEKFPNCILHREELEELAAVMTRGGKAPEIKSDGFAFDSVDDLCEHLGRDGALTLDMDGTGPFPYLRTSQYSGEISVNLLPSGQTPEGIMSFHSVASVLKRAALKKAWYSGPWAGFRSSIVFFAALTQFLHTKDQYLKAGSAVIAAIAAVLYVVSFFSTQKRTRFYGVSRKDRPSFWQRKRDDIIVGAMTGIMGFVLGIIGTLILQGHNEKGTAAPSVAPSEKTSPALTPK